MRKLFFIGLCGLLSPLASLARPLPAPIVIQGPRPTTATLRAELLEETTPMFLQKTEVGNSLSQVKFETVYDRLTRLSTYYDGHLLQDLNRTDNPYGHNRPGIGINF
jgi:hypothetical protein